VGLSRVFVRGIGAVSPAGWGVPALRAVLDAGAPLATQPLSRPGRQKPLEVRLVPPPPSRPSFLGHARLRRTSAITQFAVAAAIEAWGHNAAPAQKDGPALGIVVCVLTGNVTYSRRFYEEVLRDPPTASPLIFPETVFNAPASHLAACLGTAAFNYTLVGDEGAFLQGLALAAHWLADDSLDACLVVGAEETDWIAADALKLFQHASVPAAGAGALLLGKNSGPGAIAELAAVTGSFSFTQNQSRADAARKMRAQLPPCAADELLCASAHDSRPADRAEVAAWRDWQGARLAPKALLGEGLAAASAWQCVAACDNIGRNKFAAANVSVVGLNQQAIGARFTKPVCSASP